MFEIIPLEEINYISCQLVEGYDLKIDYLGWEV